MTSVDWNAALDNLIGLWFVLTAAALVCAAAACVEDITRNKGDRR